MFSMSKKMICLASFVLVLSLGGNLQAATVNWTDAGPDHLWSTASNWDSGTVPTSDDTARINMVPGPIVANEGAVASRIDIAKGSEVTGALTVNGGTLTTIDQLVITLSDTSTGTLNVISGTVIVGSSTNIAWRGSGTINMTGGTITFMSNVVFANKDTATCHVNLDGGIFTAANNFVMRGGAGSVGTMDVGGGTLIINSDMFATIQGHIDEGWITAYDGNGTPQLDYDFTNEGKTTLKATHFLNPNPVNGGIVGPGAVELSWTLPDPCVPDQPVTVDVYFTDDWEALYTFTDPEAIRVVSKQDVNSVVVQTQLKTQYYWAIDTYIGDPNDPIFGPTFSFYADNFSPEVYAGVDVVTWLEEGVIRTGNLDATVTDDGTIIPYTVQWTVVSEPNDPNSPGAVIADPSAEDTNITLSAVGEYVLQLEAFDGEYTSSDTVTINVYNDSCEAAQSLPDYEHSIGDLNWDCKVDDADMALLEEDWLTDKSLTEEWLLVD